MPVYDVDAHIRLNRVAAVAASPDGTWLAVQVARLDQEEKKYVSNLWRVPLDGGAAAPLTQGDIDDKAPCFRQDGALGFLSKRPLKPGAKGDEGEDERYQVWVLPSQGEAHPITDEPLGVSAFRFAEHADRLIVVTDVLPGVPFEKQRETARERRKKGPSALYYRDMPVRFWDHWIAPEAPHYVTWEGDTRIDLTPDADREFREKDWDVSSDGKLLLAVLTRVGADRMPVDTLRVFDLERGSHRDLPTPEKIEFVAPRIAPDGTQAVVAGERRHGTRATTTELHLFDLQTGTSRQLAKQWDRKPHPQLWTRDNRILVTADHEGTVPVFAVTLDDKVVQLTQGGAHESITLAGQRIAGIRHSQVHPPEPFVLDGELATLSGFQHDAIAIQESFYAGDVHTLVLRPKDAANAPALVWIHGGPVGAWADAWHWRWNPLLAVAQGYVVAMPNPAGSTGYGPAWIDRIWCNRWGAGCYEDILKATDELEKQPYVDASHIGAMGGSFGGYMANWLGGHTDRFQALVTHASLYDMAAFQGVTDWPEWLTEEFGVSQWDDREAFERYSPHRFTSQWKTPTLVIHGEKDYRVPIAEGLALFEALQHHKVPSELLIFPDENHWILKPRNVVAWYNSVFDFLARYVRQPEAARR
ncbi:MAG: S9 family peptidase [Candidatus Xenobia bacterium]